MLESDETCTMRTKSDNIDAMMGSETDEIIEELFKSLLQRYQEKLEESMRGSYFIFDTVDVLCYDLNRNKYFQYALTVALSYEQIKKRSSKISKIRLFVDQYNWKEISFPSHKKDWKKFELNNKPIALNILYVPHNTEEIRYAYKSKYNLKRENQVILLMITDGKNGITLL